jgi:hypothetical protein
MARQKDPDRDRAVPVVIDHVEVVRLWDLTFRHSERIVGEC